MASDLLYGKLSKIDELREFGEKLKNIILEKAPYLSRALANEEGKSYYNDQFDYLDDIVAKTKMVDGKLLDGLHMTKADSNPDWTVLCNIIMSRYQVSRERAEDILHELGQYETGIKRKLMQSLIHSKNQRELEQVSFSFEMPISLAVLTHITRHRMHSLLVPDFVPLWNMENYVTPETVAENHKGEYDTIFTENALMVEHFKEQGVRDEDLVYFYLSGNACNIYTTMNARTLEWISRMRGCNKAQWEIRALANEMINQASRVAPLIGEGLGPYCKVEGYCPEGKDSCMARGVVVKGLKKDK
jgi:thymidylate synthase (FAD)